MSLGYCMFMLIYHYSVLRKIACDHYRLNKHNDTTFYNYSYSFIAQRVINRRIGYSQFIYSQSNIHSLNVHKQFMNQYSQNKHFKTSVTVHIINTRDIKVTLKMF